MKKLYTTLVAVLAITHFSYAQWAAATGGIHYSSGNVGIGTTIPQSKLHIEHGSVFIKTMRLGDHSEYPLISGTQAVNGVSGHAGIYLYEDGSGGFGQASGLSFKTSLNDAAPATSLLIKSNGNVGIGTSIPASKLQVNSDNNGTGSADWIAGNFGGNSGNRVVVGLLNGVATIGSHNNALSAWSNLSINPDGGNVSIGTQDAKGYRLAVNGSAVATSMTVKLNGNWPDYVFKPTYALPSLSEVKAYIDKNQRLPEMPSDKDVEKNGIELGEMVKLQTKKIEELTLYLIDKDTQLKHQQTQIDELKAQMAKLVK